MNEHSREWHHRIAIVEDDPVVREHFIEIVSDEDGLDLAGVASNLAKAREILAQKPDLLLLDIGLPDGSGLDFIPEVRELSDTKILIVTSFGDRETVVTAIRSGADGYLLKDSSVSQILDGIEATLNGGAPVSAAAAVYLLDRLRKEKVPSVEQVESEDAGLTPREVELLELFAKGESYKEAARSLGISPLTVGNHVKSIYRKLAVHSRGEAVYEAMKTGQLKL
ncbi:MAG: response regulator transcription factor [Sphingomonadaceae bacterium]|jgi:DNA-binding NarL/FixJ family response regulator|nr:response regulator transcription factor [Sphingomonadaceae bacterium]MCP5390928.1 response regulator transcription factor [Sphingomonadaceae bacterium]MCP5394730.1 response regulator transcription factor [Sphingomonadaceae bacterium]